MKLMMDHATWIQLGIGLVVRDHYYTLLHFFSLHLLYLFLLLFRLLDIRRAVIPLDVSRLPLGERHRSPRIRASAVGSAAPAWGTRASFSSRTVWLHPIDGHANLAQRSKGLVTRSVPNVRAAYLDVPPVASRSVWIFALFFLLPLCLAGLAVAYPWADGHTLLSDPYEIAWDGRPLHPLMGSFSTFGGVFFLCTAAITLFGATLTPNMYARSFLITAGLYSSLLGNDDLFGLHDVIIPKDLMLHERYAKVFYLLFQVLYLLAFWRLIMRFNYVLLGAAIAAFAMSWAFDSPNFFPRIQALAGGLGYDIPVFSARHEGLEDGPKLLGIILWLWFHVLATRKILITGLEKTLSREASS